MKAILKNVLPVCAGTVLGSLSLAASAFDILPDRAPAPADNPTTPAKVSLGKQLYFDQRLSVNGTVSCNSCHSVMANGTDNRPVSVGVFDKRGGRSAPTVWNAAFLSVQFWDGRAASLEDQAKGPILAGVEMGMPSEAAVVERLKQIPGYVSQFQAVFGGEDALTYDNVARAIAAFERTLITPNAAVDRFLKGDKSALSASAQRGMKLVEKIGCTSCHTGPNYAGPAGLPVGQGFFQKFPVYPSKYDKQYDLKSDKGRYEVTHDDADKHLWRVPTWRNVALTAPYFHNGSVQTLDEAVRVMAKSQLDVSLSDAEVADIVAFLNGLSGEFPEITLPRLPETPNVTLLKK
ncbi:MAG TPA: cytochrome-c peroxidase [Gammaproteobacteria bacterium]|nr:cytochrome-c peroxidase [Gammaproteobacteria bacterium]